jgi:hypothetical protein
MMPSQLSLLSFLKNLEEIMRLERRCLITEMLLPEMVGEVLLRPLACCLLGYRFKLSPGRIAEIQFSVCELMAI